MKIINKIESELHEAEYNPRKISDKDMAQLKKSLEKFTVVEPIVVNSHPKREGVIIGGHQRFKAMKSLGYTEFPCIEVSLNKKEEKELNIRLNKNSGEFNLDLLSEHFDTEDLLDFGFESFELAIDNQIDYEEEWEGMPEFKQKDLSACQSIHIHFMTPKDVEDFSQLISQPITKKTKTVWFPKEPKLKNSEGYTDEK